MIHAQKNFDVHFLSYNPIWSHLQEPPMLWSKTFIFFLCLLHTTSIMHALSSYNSNSPPQDSSDAPNGSHPVSHPLTDFQTPYCCYMFPQYGKSDPSYIWKPWCQSFELASRVLATVVAQQQSASRHVRWTAIERAWVAVPVLVSGLCNGSRRPGEAWW